MSAATSIVVMSTPGRRSVAHWSGASRISDRRNGGGWLTGAISKRAPPPGWKDRRREAERRIPEVGEVAYGEWARLRAEKGLPDAAAAEHEALNGNVIRD